MKYNWVRVTDVTPYIESEDWAQDTCALAHRLYAPEGRQYPLLFIGIYVNIGHSLDKKPITGVKVSCSSKQASGEWWDEYGDAGLIPLDLLADLQEMLLEIKSKI